MDAEKEVELLLQAVFSARRDLEELKESAETKNKQAHAKLDRSIGALATRSKKLIETTKSLSTQVDECDKRLEVLKTEQLLNGGAQKDADTIVQAGEMLGQLQNILTIRNNPVTIENMRSPPATFAIVGFKERKKSDSVFYTDPFYSHLFGYKMCLKIHFNGYLEGKGTHISIFWILLPGEFDEILEWPFSGRVVIQLVNQRKDKLHHSKTLALCSDENLKYRQRPKSNESTALKDRLSWGYDKFFPHVDLPAKGFLADQEFLKNDTLLIRVYKFDNYNLRY